MPFEILPDLLSISRVPEPDFIVHRSRSKHGSVRGPGDAQNPIFMSLASEMGGFGIYVPKPDGLVS